MSNYEKPSYISPPTRTIENAIHIKANHLTLGMLPESSDQPALAVITTSSNLNCHGIFFEMTAPMLRDYAARMIRLSAIIDGKIEREDHDSIA